MVRAPAKSCPNLSRLLEDAGPAQLAAFLRIKEFQKFEWLHRYRFEDSDVGTERAVGEMLASEKKDRLGPLETEATRILTVAGARGQFVLEGLAKTKLDAVQAKLVLDERDDLARSLAAFLFHRDLFEAAENTLHMRMYRRYDKHYQTFLAEPSESGGPAAGSEVLDVLLSDLRAELDRGDGYSIDKFDVPADGDEPAAEMYLLFHPNPPNSVREIDDHGNRSRIYFRPPGEAMIFYTPSTGRVHVRAGTRVLRHSIAERFIETALEQTYSNQPVDFQAEVVLVFRPVLCRAAL